MSGYNFRDRWLRTDDEDYVVLIPALEDEDIRVLRYSDGDVPEGLEFNLACTLKDSVQEEVMAIAHEFGVKPDFTRMDITWRQA